MRSMHGVGFTEASLSFASYARHLLLFLVADVVASLVVVMREQVLSGKLPGCLEYGVIDALGKEVKVVAMGQFMEQNTIEEVLVVFNNVCSIFDDC